MIFLFLKDQHIEQETLREGWKEIEQSEEKVDYIQFLIEYLYMSFR